VWFVISRMGIIVRSNIRKMLDGLNLGEDLAVELERKVERILEKASERAKKNSRRTVYARDL
jgi:histone H3/H4